MMTIEPTARQGDQESGFGQALPQIIPRFDFVFNHQQPHQHLSFREHS
jgi:hypothetical protein